MSTSFLFCTSVCVISQLLGGILSVDILVSPSIIELIAGQNNFTSISHYKRFNPSYELLQFVDLSNNHIHQAALDIFGNIPPNLHIFTASSNSITGPLPSQFPMLDSLIVLALDQNDINGSLPDLSRSTPLLQRLDLSNQTEGGGIRGAIPSSFSELTYLVSLNLASNKLSESIPSVLGNLERIVELNVSNNELGERIPSELGKLASVEMLDMTYNIFSNNIPSELGMLEHTKIMLQGNCCM